MATATFYLPHHTPINSWQLLSPHYVHNFVILNMSQKWNPAECNLLRLAFSLSLTLYLQLVNQLNLLTISGNYFVDILRIFTQTIVSPTNTIYLLLLLQSECILLYFFFWFLALVRTFSIVQNKRDDTGHSCLVPNFSGKVFSLSLLNVVSTVGVFVDALYHIKEVPFCS